MEVLPEFDVYLRRAGVTVTARDVALLRAIDEHGSLNRAASVLGRSYSHAQQRIVELESAFGPLVERTRGGSGGGGSQLTDRANALESRFERLRIEFGGVTDTAETMLSGRIVDRDGRIVTVETPAGTVRGIAPTEVELHGAERTDETDHAPRGERARSEIRLVVRADAVTLHDPSASPQEDDTSARNQLTGAVTEVADDETVALVAVDVGAAVALRALVTTGSIERLALEPGVPVVASFKATATRGVPTVEVDGDDDGDVDGDGDRDRDGDGDGDRDRDGDGDGDRDGDVDGDGERDGDVDGDGERDGDTA